VQDSLLQAVSAALWCATGFGVVCEKLFDAISMTYDKAFGS
jgi:hypothetical protein